MRLQIFGFIGVKYQSIHFGGGAADEAIAATFASYGFLVMMAIDTVA